MSRCVGVDLAVDPRRTGLAITEWYAGGATVTVAEGAADDGAIVEAATGAVKIGVDCPLGWPDAFIDFVVRHRAGEPAEPGELPASVWRRHLALRRTDMAVSERPLATDARGRLVRLVPLSVSTDRIGLTAMRAAALLTQMRARNISINRDGSGAVVEVYPAASLLYWTLDHRGYKRSKNLINLSALVDALREVAPWLRFDGAAEHNCRRSDHAFDALIAALTARAATVNCVTRPNAEQQGAARREGWIAVPTAPLEALRE